MLRYAKSNTNCKFYRWPRFGNISAFIIRFTYVAAYFSVIKLPKLSRSVFLLKCKGIKLITQT